jgi:hypothetical protein
VTSLPPFEPVDVEDWLNFAMHLQSLVRAEHFTPEDRLFAINEALVRAVGGNGKADLQKAIDFVDQVTLGPVP